MRILLVEDNPVVQMAQKRLLQREGYVVDMVANGERALEQFATVGYDAVLLDMDLPDMSGIELARRLHAQYPKQAHVPLIALTANTRADIRERCLNAGIHHFLVKPLDCQAFNEIMKTYLQA